MYLDLFYLVISIAILTFGADLALEASEKVGRAFGLSPLLVGLFLVAFGTSLPEFFVSQLASLKGNTEIAMGNIIGSNVANILLILGLSAIFTTIDISDKFLRFQFLLHFVIIASLGVVFLVSDGHYIAWSLLFATFFFYFVLHSYIDMKKQKGTTKNQKEEIDHIEKAQAQEIKEFSESKENQGEKLVFALAVKLFAGFTMLYAGGELLVYAAKNIATVMSIPEYVVSVILIAFGTSLPELATSAMACIKNKDTDIITGNVIGSNIFNVAFVFSSIGVYNFKFTRSYYVEIIVLLIATLILLAVNHFKIKLGRFIGTTFILMYLGMVIYWI